jgi:hypothetical protein
MVVCKVSVLTCKLPNTLGMIISFFFTLLIKELSHASTRDVQSLITLSTSNKSRYKSCLCYIICNALVGQLWRKASKNIQKSEKGVESSFLTIR